MEHGAVADTHPDLQPQSRVTGYGPELEDALERYSLASPERGARKKLLSDFASWLERSPFQDHLCFADFFFIPPNTESTDSLAFVIVPSTLVGRPPQHNVYWKALADFWGESFEYALATHEQFRLGLPHPPKEGRTESGLLLAALSEMTGQRSLGEEELAVARETEAPLPPRRFGPGQAKKLLAVDLGAPFAAATSRAEMAANSKPLRQVWNRWKETFAGYRASLLSGGGRPLEWLVACPVGYRSVSEMSRYSRFATVFVGFDADMSREQVLEAFRYILLHLYESNATSIAERRGKAEGMAWRLTATAHEVDKVIDAIRPGLSPMQSRVMRDYLKLMVAETDGFNPFNLTQYSLHEQIWRQVERAAQIECIVDNARGKCALVCKSDDADSDMRKIVEVVRQSSVNYVPDDLDDIDPADRVYFSHAVLAGLRNAIRHSFFRGHQHPSMKIYIKEIEGDTVLSIENSFLREEEIAVHDKPTGTRPAVIGYVSQYRGNVDLVRLEQKKYKNGTDSPYEMWVTHIPFPPMRSGI